jgi:hypothetical protein
MNRILLLAIWILALTGNGACSDVSGQDRQWPKRYRASFGFELMADHNGTIIVSSIDSTSIAYRLGMRPGMEVMGWNTLPVKERMESMNVRRYRKYFPLMSDQKIRMMLITRGRPGETAEVFFLTGTGNNRGIRIKAAQ